MVIKFLQQFSIEDTNCLTGDKGYIMTYTAEQLLV